MKQLQYSKLSKAYKEAYHELKDRPNAPAWVKSVVFDLNSFIVIENKINDGGLKCK